MAILVNSQGKPYQNQSGKVLNAPSGGEVSVEPLSVTANGTYTAPSGKAYSPVDVDVPNPSTGKVNITDMAEVNVTNYATAQVVDADLVESNIKSGVNILGVTGNYTGDATATAEDIVTGKTAYVNSQKITGTHVEPTFTTEEKTVTPTESLQTITPTSTDGLSKVTVNAISSTYVGSGVTRQGAKTVTPTKSSQTAVASGVYTTGAISVGAIPSNYVDVSGSTNVSAGNLLTGTKAYNSSGTLVTGNMANNGANNVTISSKSGATIPSGYYNGSGKAVIDSTSSTNLVEDNIKKGISILGITGTFEGSGGSSNIKSGSASLTTSSSTTNIKITDTSTIGFTPKAFFVWADTNQTSRYYVNSSYFITQGSGYRRSTLYRGSSSDSVLNATTTWTTSTNGYLYFNSNTIYFRNTSSYRIATATYRWIALTW